MKSFKDNQGQQWNLSLTLGKVRQIREKLGIDLLNPTHYQQLITSLTDRLAYCFLLCEEQGREIGVNDGDDFEERLYGDGISDGASDAFIGETVLFFQKLGQKSMAVLAEKSWKLHQAGQAKVHDLMSTGQFASLLDRAEQEAMDKIDTEMDKALALNDGSGS